MQIKLVCKDDAGWYYYPTLYNLNDKYWWGLPCHNIGGLLDSRIVSFVGDTRNVLGTTANLIYFEFKESDFICLNHEMFIQINFYTNPLIEIS